MADEQRDARHGDAPGLAPEARADEYTPAASPQPQLSQGSAPGEASRSRLLGELLREVVFQVDANERLAWLEPPWERLTGMTVGAWLGRSLVEVFHPEDQGRARALLRSVATQPGAVVRDELRLEPASEGGGLRWVELSARALASAPGEVVGTLMDVTSRRQAQEAVTTRERYLEAMVEVQRRMMPQESPMDLYGAVVEPLGHVSAASRVYVFEMHRGDDEVVLASQRAEWCAPGIPPNLNDPEMHGLPLLAALRPEQAARLLKGEPVQGLPTDFSDMLKPVLDAQGVRSVLLLPLHVHGQLFGVIGFDNCREARPWGPSR
ncbi:PAS domain-containing protein [Pyxidicoccus sp. 3LG]